MRAASNASAGTMRFSAACSVLRRWPNAASIRRNVDSRSAEPTTAACSAGEYRSKRTSAESTFGAGQNTLRPMLPTRFAVPYQASFTLGVP